MTDTQMQTAQRTGSVGLVITALLTLATILLLTCGVVSHWRGIPCNSILIYRAAVRPQLHVAILDGILHAVVSAPRSISATGDTEWGWDSLYFRRQTFGATEAVGVGVPSWLLAIPISAVPVWRFVGIPLRRYTRQRRGQCACCGYPLSGLPGPRCPECGQPLVMRGTDSGLKP